MQAHSFQNFMTKDEADEFLGTRDPKRSKLKRMRLGSRWKYRVYWW